MTQGGDEGQWWPREMVTKGSGEEGKWWRREVVRKGSGDDGKWWRREVVRKGSGDDGMWWRWEVVTKESGDEGKWWGREVVRKGSGDEGKWWGREVVMKGSGDDGKWWRRKVVTKGSGEEGKWWEREGDEGKWWRREVVRTGSGDEGKWWRECCKMHCNGCMSVAWALFWGGSRSTKPCVFPCKVAAAGDERYLVCAAVAASVANVFLLCVLQRVVVPVCAVLFVFWICGCRSQWNGCMIVVIWCCHVRREMRVSHVMLQNAL